MKFLKYFPHFGLLALIIFLITDIPLIKGTSSKIKSQLQQSEGSNSEGANLLLSYSKNAIISDIKISTTTKSDACFDNELFDRILCNALRKLESDSPPFYGEYRNYHRDDLF